jgi:hypothetical protein
MANDDVYKDLARVSPVLTILRHEGATCFRVLLLWAWYAFIVV